MNAVVTVCVGDLYEAIGKVSHSLMRKYADKIGAEFVVLDTKALAQTTPHWEKFQIFDLLNKYDRIFYVDTDVLIRPDCPNVFDIVQYDKMGMFNEAPYTEDRRLSLIQSCQDYGVTLPQWNGKYYNTGVMVISRTHKYLFKKPEKEVFNFYEQGYLNVMVAKMGTWMFDLPYKFNRMCCMDRVTGEERFDAYVIHYAGIPDVKALPGLMQVDAKKLEDSAPEYKFKKHIVIDVQGGLGDQVDAEPTLRYLLKNIYPNDDVRVKTHFPRLFIHLDVPVFEHGDPAWTNGLESEPYHAITLPSPETMMWSVVSNLMCHTVDFVSMAVLRRVLPNNDKRVKLLVESQDVANLLQITGGINVKDYVIVHPGRHWANKTFPESWWQDIIKGLCAKKIPVCVFGKEEGIRGVLRFDVPKEVLDLRNLLDIGSMIALIAAAKVCVSNDSAPVHIAGAFDNGIVLIPTCKHPDHILPWRDERDFYYRAVSLCKKLVLDDVPQAPTLIDGQLGDHIPSGNLLDYLPATSSVIEETAKLYKEVSE